MHLILYQPELTCRLVHVADSCWGVVGVHRGDVPAADISVDVAVLWTPLVFWILALLLTFQTR